MNTPSKKKFNIYTVSANLLAFSASAAFAQEQAPQPTASGEVQPVVVVSGFKKSYSNALVMKRQAVGVTDSISSEGLDRFPDLNVGEALQRVPGIQVNREEDSRNATINLRGLPGAYAKTTLNGMDFATPVLGGSAPLGAFDSDIFSAITVVKSVSAADPSGGISGNIDLQIQPALSRTEGASIKIADEYNSLGKYNSPKVSVNASKKYMDGKLGVFGVLAWKQENFRRDSLNIPQYTTLNTRTPDFLNRFKDYYASDVAGSAASCSGVTTPCVATAGGTGLISKAGITAPTDMRQSTKFNEGELMSGAFGAEFKAAQGLKLGANYFFTRRDMPLTATDILDLDMRDANTTLDPTSAPFKHTDGRYYISDYKFTNPRVFGSYRLESFKQASSGLDLKGSYVNDDWRIDAAAMSSRATNFGYQSQLDVRNNAKAITSAAPSGNGLSGSLNLGAGIGNYGLALNQTTPALSAANTAGPWTYGGTGPAVNNANGDTFIVAGSDNWVENKVSGLKLDLERYLEMGWLDSLQFGAQLTRNKYHSKGYTTPRVIVPAPRGSTTARSTAVSSRRARWPGTTLAEMPATICATGKP
jgi:TonB-dependent receptor